MPPTLQLLDSIAYLERAGARIAGDLLVSGSHAGLSAAQFVIDHPERPLLVLFNDAGIGKDDAGVAGLATLQHHGVATAAYSHRSARIGEASDGLAHGIITRANPLAAAMGIEAGDRVEAIVARLGARLAG